MVDLSMAMLNNQRVIMVENCFASLHLAQPPTNPFHKLGPLKNLRTGLTIPILRSSIRGQQRVIGSPRGVLKMDPPVVTMGFYTEILGQFG